MNRQDIVTLLKTQYQYSDLQIALASDDIECMMEMATPNDRAESLAKQIDGQIHFFYQKAHDFLAAAREYVRQMNYPEWVAQNFEFFLIQNRLYYSDKEDVEKIWNKYMAYQLAEITNK